MFYFFLGNTPELSRLELQSLLSTPLTSVTPSIISSTADPSIFAQFGGIRKVAESVKTVARDQVLSALSSIYAVGIHKTLAVTDYADLHLTSSDLVQVKKSLSRPVRFVSLDTSEHELLMLSHQHVDELNLLPAGGAVDIARTVWIFPAEEWVERDRHKPYRDIKRGMLPPKLARILVNLGAMGKKGLSLTDPFCGTGTVLSEALLSGCSHVYGSDTFGPAVRGAETNLQWLCDQFELQTSNFEIRLSDATHLSSVVPRTDLIVTEPYMGPLMDRHLPPLEKIADIARGLDKLYRGCFRDWRNVLPEGGRVVMTIPQFKAFGRTIPTISVDTITSLGYNYISSVAYGKPSATVIRNITILERK